ncbi:MAG: crosslink repair DNA glycosylase YcaQ family protein [Pseudomonadota bacterium]
MTHGTRGTRLQARCGIGTHRRPRWSSSGAPANWQSAIAKTFRNASILRNGSSRKTTSRRIQPTRRSLTGPAPRRSTDWALRRPGELAKFWDLISPVEAKTWCAERMGQALIEVEIENADGTWRKHVARPDLPAEIDTTLDLPGHVRVLSPFDPALRDRNRAERLFGFHYRIEIFVPEAKRQYGYYVFPVLEGDRLIGRMDAKRDAAKGVLTVSAFWPEHGVRMGKGRVAKFEVELDRLAKFAGCEKVEVLPDWIGG